MRLAIPNMLVMLSQAAIGLIETYFLGKRGVDALTLSSGSKKMGIA
jgi:Na+-driven multidrug efflux pump